MRPAFLLFALSACPGSDTDVDPSDTDVPAGDAVIDGDPNGFVKDALPNLPVPDPADTEDDWLLDQPVPVSRKRFLVMFADNAITGEINTAFAPFDVTLVGANPVVGYLVGEVDPEVTDLGILLADLNSHPGVVAAQPDVALSAMTLPADAPFDTDVEETACAGAFQHWSWESPTTGANWGLKRAKLPFAWTLFDDRQTAPAPPIAVFEKGFDTDHIDVVFDADTPDGNTALSHQSHGTGVASIISALHDGGGVAGVLPNGIVDAPIRGRIRPVSLLHTAEVAEFDAIVRHIQDTDTQLINFSAGTLYADDGLDARPTDGFVLTAYTTTYADLADHRGAVWNTATERLARDVRDDFLIFCAAGNDGERADGYVFQARDTSGCTNAATRLSSPRLLAIENLAPGYVPASSSQRGGSLAAPGTCMGMAEPDDTYSSYSGTSYAAPFALGVAAVVWMQAPELDALQVRQALEDGAEESVGGSALRINAWGALMAADAIAGDEDIALAVADVDDGTLDGMLRVLPSGAASPVPQAHGDGCIDMADARALRDAIVLSGSPATLDIDGGLNHPARDLNGDGERYGIVGAALETPPEHLWSRFDQNADNVLDAIDIGFLADQWGECADGGLTSRTQGWSAARLFEVDPVSGDPFSELLGTIDVWVPVSSIGETLVMVHGAPAMWVALGHPDLVMDAGTAYLQRTVPLPCTSTLPRVCSRTRVGDGLSPLVCSNIPGNLGPGSDVVVDPADGVPVELGTLLFTDERAIHYGGPLVADALRHVASGILQPARYDIEDEDIDLWGAPTLSPDLRWAFWSSCVDYTENGDLECLAMVEMPEFERDEANPWDASDVHVRGFSAEGQQLLVQERPERSFNDHRFWSVDLDRLADCVGDCDRDDLWREMNPGDRDALAAPHAVRRDGSMLFDDSVSRGIAIVRTEGRTDGAVCMDAEPEVWFAPVSELWGLAHSQPSPVATTDRVLAWRDDGGTYTLAIVSPDGSVDVLADGYSGLPTNAAAWGPGGRSIAVREPTGRVSMSLIDINGDRIADTELANSPEFSTAQLTFAPDGERVAAYIPSANSEPSIGVVHVYETLLGSELVAFDVHDEHGGPMWSATGQSIAYTVRNEGQRTDLDIVVRRLDTGDVSNLTSDIKDASCAVSDPENCAFSDQRGPIWSRPLR